MAKYLNKDKFCGNKPLLKYPNSSYPDRLELEYNEFEEPKEFDLYEAIRGNKIELGDRKIIFGVKAKEEELTKYDFLDSPASTLVVHQKVLDRLNELCPDDIQALPTTIKNCALASDPFENKDFWLINILNIVDAIDQEKSEAYWNEYLHSLKFKKKMYLKDVSCLGVHMLARVMHFKPRIIFHPLLAKHFIKSKGIQFLTDEETLR